ncbi:MAG TPA: hypothetical protein VEB23_07115, partial [Ramlibacter sp.]|nr:hypothetical protein [Ramlibacter sp.]
DAVTVFRQVWANAEAERTRGVAPLPAPDHTDLLREAGEVIESMAAWFRRQPLGAPPAGTAALQARIRAALASGVRGQEGERG